MSDVKDIVIIVATHKQYAMPKDKMYIPLEVGVLEHGKKTEYVGDGTGDNISEKNSGYSELTGLYWAWKNLKNDYVGLVHYRRYFADGKRTSGDVEQRLKKVLTKEHASRILEHTDVILPKERNYYIENLYDHYAHTMHKEPLDITGEIIAEKYPEFVAEFEKLHTRKKAHMFNMMIMKKAVFDEYCEWLFAILFELEKRVNAVGLTYDGFHGRFYGRVSELLLDVYVNTKSIRYQEVPVFSIESVNWVKKGGSFLKAKVFKQKYKKSF